MKFSIAVLFVALATVTAKEGDLKDRLLEHRDDQFRNNDVGNHGHDSMYPTHLDGSVF